MSDPAQDNQRSEEYDVFRQEYASLEVTDQNRAAPPPLPKKDLHKQQRQRLLGMATLVLIVVLALLTGITALIRTSQKPETSVVINTQSLDNGTLNQLSAEAGENAKQQLTIFPETLFRQSVTTQGSVTVQQNLDVSGALTVKGPTRLQGDTTIDENTTMQRNLTVARNTAIGGNLSVTGSVTAASLSVGSITISTVNVSNDISFGGHLIPNGAAPKSRASVAALGGSVTVSGNDTAGTVTINTGNGSGVTGEMAIITFNRSFTTTPKVQLTPINTPASAINYFATRSANFFTIETSSPPASGTTYVFDYFVTQ